MKIIPCIAVVLSLVGPVWADKIVQVAGEGLKEPFGTEFDSKGTMYVVEMLSGNRLWRVAEGGKLTQMAKEAKFNGPHNLAVLPDGDVLIGDTWNGKVQKIAVKTGAATTLKGWQVPAEKAKGSGPYCITLDFTGTKLYIANLTQVFVLDLATDTSKVVAGNGKKGRPEDGAVAVDAPLSDPRAVAVDRKGNIYILERGGNALRVVGTDGKIRTVVNASGKKGGEGDGGPALDATMNGPKHLCIDQDDSVIIADAESHLVRRYVPATGKIVRIAGTGKMGSAGVGGDPQNCQVARPHGVTVHPLTGELYITDSYNNRVLKIVK